MVWSVISFVVLLAGIGAIVWYFAVLRHAPAGDELDAPETDPLLGLNPTASMQATLKYFWVVVALILVRVSVGIEDIEDLLADFAHALDAQ